MRVTDLLENKQEDDESINREIHRVHSLRFREKHYRDIVDDRIASVLGARRGSRGGFRAIEDDAHVLVNIKHPIKELPKEYQFWIDKYNVFVIPKTPSLQPIIDFLQRATEKHHRTLLALKAAEKSAKEALKKRQDKYGPVSMKLPPIVYPHGRTKHINLPTLHEPQSKLHRPYYGPPQGFSWHGNIDLARTYKRLAATLQKYGIDLTIAASDGSSFVCSDNPDFARAKVLWRWKPQAMAAASNDVYISGEKFSPNQVIREDEKVIRAISFANQR